MADDRDARIARLELEVAVLRERASVATERVVQIEAALGEALEHQEAASDVLRAIGRSPADLRRVLDAIAESAARLCDAENVGVWRHDGAATRLVGRHGRFPSWTSGIDGPPRALDSTRIEDQAILEGRTIHVGDIHSDADRSRFPSFRESSRRSGWRAALIVPLMRDDEAIGALAAFRNVPGRFTDQQIRLLETFADQAVIAIENARLFQELQERTEQLAHSVEDLRALGEVGTAVSSSLELTPVLSTIVALAARLSRADGGSLYEYDEANETLHRSGPLPPLVPDDVDEDTARTFRRRAIRLGEGAVGRAVLTRGPVQIPDILVPGSYDSSVRDTLVKAGFRSLLAVPLLQHDRPLGALVVVRRAAGELSAEVVALLQTVAGLCALAIHHARLHRQVATQGRALEEVSRHTS
jgi:GAF domain-containing protein